MRNKKTINSIIFFLLTLLILASIARADTIGDSTVSVNINDKFRWIVTKHTQGAPFTTDDEFNLTVQDVYGLGGYLNMDVILDYYNNSEDTWTAMINNSLYLTFNETLDIIEYQVGIYSNWGLIFIIPTPLNLTLIGEYINSTYGGMFSSKSIVNTTLSLNYSIGYANYIYTYNETGVLTKFTIQSTSPYYPNTIIHEMVLEADVSDGDDTDGDGTNGDGTDGDGTDGDGTDGGNGIPFGNTFILITIIGTLICILSIRRKLNKN